DHVAAEVRLELEYLPEEAGLNGLAFLIETGIHVCERLVGEEGDRIVACSAIRFARLSAVATALRLALERIFAERLPRFALGQVFEPVDQTLDHLIARRSTAPSRRAIRQELLPAFAGQLTVGAGLCARFDVDCRVAASKFVALLLTGAV